MFPLVSLIFLKRSLVFPILLFSSISFHCSLKMAFLSLPAILWNSASSWVYLSLYLLPLVSLLFSAICKTSSDNHLAFLHLFFFGMVLVTASCATLWTSVHSLGRVQGSKWGSEPSCSQCWGNRVDTGLEGPEVEPDATNPSLAEGLYTVGTQSFVCEVFRSWHCECW